MVIAEEKGATYLIFVMGLSEEQFHDINLQTIVPILKVKEASTKQRIEMYLKGGIFAPTPNTLILDLLSKKLSPHIITGFIIMNAEKSLKGSHAFGVNSFMSNVQFCLKVFRRDNKDGFIKAFSANPGAVAGKATNIQGKSVIAVPLRIWIFRYYESVLCKPPDFVPPHPEGSHTFH